MYFKFYIYKLDFFREFLIEHRLPFFFLNKYNLLFEFIEIFISEEDISRTA
jgi:hypothetical protein